MSNFIWDLEFYGFSDRNNPPKIMRRTRGNLPKHLRTSRFPSMKTSITVYFIEFIVNKYLYVCEKPDDESTVSTHSTKIIIQLGALNKMLWLIWMLFNENEFFFIFHSQNKSSTVLRELFNAFKYYRAVGDGLNPIEWPEKGNLYTGRWIEHWSRFFSQSTEPPTATEKVMLHTELGHKC